MIVRVSTVEEVQDAVRSHARLRPVAGGSKPALSRSLASTGAEAPIAALDLSGLSGIIDFSPAECVFSARPGTRIAEIESRLAQHGLYLPFEPPLADRGATLGGTIAAGLSGPGRFRYGGVRDFLLGVTLVDGTGRVVHGGGRVVKNAAGFSLQHLMLGSLGRLGAFVEVTCKVFPRSPARVTLDAACGSLAAAVETMGRLRRSTFELDACELLPAAAPNSTSATLRLRMAGLASALDERVELLTAFLAPAAVRRLSEAEGERFWHDARQLTDILPHARPVEDDVVVAASSEDDAAWAGDEVSLVKVALTPSRIAPFEEALARVAAGTAGSRRMPSARRRYSAGGELAWIAWPSPLDPLERALRALDLSGLILSDTVSVDTADRAGTADAADTAAQAPRDPILGTRPDDRFLTRVRQALDPRGVFA